MTKREFPPAYAHGEISEVFDDVFFVTGTVGLPGPLPVRFSRNMTVIRQDGALTVVNSMRLDEKGLAALDKLGKVENVIRIAGFHGMDDPFYQSHYGAKVWALKGQRYVEGFETKSPNTYFEPDHQVDATTELPIRNAKLYLFSCKPAEGLLLLEKNGGILIAGDSLQNWQKPDQYFSLAAKLMMRMMGFIKPFNLGPGWLKAAKPSSKELTGLLDLTFDNVLPAHGSAVIGGAKASYRPIIDSHR